MTSKELVNTSTEGVSRQPSAEEGGMPGKDQGEGCDPGILSAQEYAANFKLALDMADHARPRSVQTSGGILGASDAGGCPHKAVLTVRHTPPTDVVKKGRARIGTALHAAMLADVQELFPERIIEAELVVTLPSGTQVPLHPDEIDPVHNTVVDYKFVADLDYRRAIGVQDKEHMQRNLQALAAIQAGLVKEDGLLVGNLFVSMTDSDDVWVDLEPFSMAWVRRADEWFSDVRYAVEHDEDGRKDAPWYVCKDYCPFVSMCKPPMVDAMGELHSEALREAVLVGNEAVAQRKHWERLEKQAKTLLKGVSGKVGNVQTVSTWVNSGSGYYKQEFRDV